ncbi:MAG: HAMP domain-containing protein [Rhodospirillaceae bacterium]|jgi:two-component system, OmpR family, osmolarity sensor histidine kinase EnvZ|nr:HAMP domain-containing protein [Rhodospirillaceae bacterium]MBT6405058.1 HAMP domain-containing protein [Rhodospirillaceae bacterium]MBT6535167.1 HAMP domain-containing protein [Rhodospirillaceae bacterium]
MARLDALARVPRILRLTLKQFLPRGLLARSLLIIVVPLVLLQVVSGVIFYDRHWSNVSRHRATALAGDISMVLELINENPASNNQPELFELARRTLDLIFEYEVGTILPNTHFEPAGNLEVTLSRSLREIVQRPFLIDTRSQRDRVLIDVQLPSGVLKVSANEERLISSTTKIFILWMIGTSLILFAVATLFMRNQVSPIRRLATAAENFGKGRDTPNFKPSGATEVRQAASAFMAMRNRLERQIQQRTDMLSGVSHDLRTPLTRMKLQLAMLNRNTEIDELNSDVAAMESMIEGYLNFARGEGTEERQLIDAGALLEEVAHDARRNGTDITAHVEEPVELPLARAAIRRCLTNLADNAARHAEKVEMRLSRNGSVLEITVDDDGPGIPEDMRDDVFRPFFRLDESRNLETGGTGLGLSIAQDIVHGHGGEISLGESPAGGLRVLIRIPI